MLTGGHQDDVEDRAVYNIRSNAPTARQLTSLSPAET